MGSIQGALAPYDEAAVFTYTNGAKEWTGFTGAQSARLPAVLSLAQATGSDPMVPITSGPLAGCSIRQNGNCPDPNLQPGSRPGMAASSLPKEIHTLNDAILAAAKELSTRPKDRLRIIYVISDGKEYGSKATWKEVVRYLQTNKIAVYATAGGRLRALGRGWLDRFHLPFTGVYAVTLNESIFSRTVVYTARVSVEKMESVSPLLIPLEVAEVRMCAFALL